LPKTSQGFGTIIAIGLRTGIVAVIGEEAVTQVSWDDAFTSGNTAPMQFSIGCKPKTNKERTQMKMIKNFLKDESGMETLEYAVIAGLIAAVAVLVYASGWGTTLQTRLQASSTTS
jgi:Flp pilus assembly pilin Flp